MPFLPIGRHAPCLTAATVSGPKGVVQLEQSSEDIPSAGKQVVFETGDDSISTHADGHQGSNEGASCMSEEGMWPGSSLGADGGFSDESWCRSEDGIRYIVKNTFIEEYEPASATPTCVTKSCTAAMWGSAPQYFPSPPPETALDFVKQEPALPSPSAPEPTLPSLPAPPDTDGGQVRVTVRNTFISIEEDRPDRGERSAITCMARLDVPAQIFPEAAGGTRCVFDSEDPTAAARAAAPVPAPVAPLSLGSELHGTVGADGLPACQPCAWFYKESGCLNAAGCRYCHLCPRGELKNRKKQKITRLRNQEAAAAKAASTAAPATATAPRAVAVPAAQRVH